jgi:hypothetical protein
VANAIPQAQPLEIIDFSGGITDNFFDSGPSRGMAFHNFFVTVDRKLEQRGAFVPFSDTACVPPGPLKRSDALLLFINESKIFLGQGRDIYVLPEADAAPSWTRLVGPSGNQALGAGGEYSVFSTSEFQHQIYVTNDSQPIPTRIYRDTLLNYQARTAGLPKVQLPNPWSDASLTAKCIANANALRTSMIAHLSDVGGGSQNTPSATNLHFAADPIGLALLAVAPPAFDATSLYTLIAALVATYLDHASTAGLDAYHYNENIASLKRNFAPIGVLSNPNPVTTIPDAAAALDDLYQKWYWHQMAVNLHGQGTVNNFALMYQYIVAETKIGTVVYDRVQKIYPKTSPTVIPNYADLLSYVNGLMAVYNGHLGGGGAGQNSALYPALFNTLSWKYAHTQTDSLSKVTIPLALSLDDAFLCVAWMRMLYDTGHSQDLVGKVLNEPFGDTDPTPYNARVITFNTTAGSPNITGATYVNGPTAGQPVVFTVGDVLFTPFGTAAFSGGSGQTRAATVTVANIGSCTVNRNGAATTTVFSGSLSPMQYHTVVKATLIGNTSSPLIDGQVSLSNSQKLSFSSSLVATTIPTLLAYAQDFLTAFFAHVVDTTYHYSNPPSLALTRIPADPQMDPVFPGDAISQFNSTNTPAIQNWYVPDEVTALPSPTYASVVYAFTRSNEYIVDPAGLTYRVESNPVYSQSIGTFLPWPVGYAVPTLSKAWYNDTIINVSHPVNISGVPALVNDSSTNYDTANCPVNIYRTTDGGTTFYLVGTITNGVATYSDSANDTLQNASQPALNSGLIIYTSGGVVGNDQPPQCKYTHILNGIAYYANIIDTGQYFPNRIRQALPLSPDSAPATFYLDLPDEITGISSNRQYLIAFCKNSLGQITGQFNSLGQGSMSYQPISQRIGCLGQKSIVQTEVGVFFAGTDGFYYTDGFQLIKISIDLDNSYQGYTISQAQKDRIAGAYDKLNRRIWWTIQSSVDGTDCDLVWVYYLNYGIKPSGVFTTLGNDSSLVPAAGNPNNYEYFSPSALAFYKGQMVMAHTTGLVFKFDHLQKADVKWDLTAPQSQWGTIAMPYDYASCAMDYGTHFKRKYATKINVMGKNVGNYEMVINSNSDNGRVVRSLAPVNYRDNCRWGDPLFTWGAPTFVWDEGGKSDFWRRFPASTLRSNIRQVQFTNARVGVYRYEDFPVGATITCDSVLKTATIATPPGYTKIVWPIDATDMYLATSLDGFVAEYRIISVGAVPNVEDTFLTVDDPGNTFPNVGNLSWVIRGYKKNQRVQISSYVVHFSLLGDKNSKYASAADSGENT